MARCSAKVAQQHNKPDYHRHGVTLNRYRGESNGALKPNASSLKSLYVALALGAVLAPWYFLAAFFGYWGATFAAFLCAFPLFNSLSPCQLVGKRHFCELGFKTAGMVDNICHHASLLLNQVFGFIRT